MTYKNLEAKLNLKTWKKLGTWPKIVTVSVLFGVPILFGLRVAEGKKSEVFKQYEIMREDLGKLKQQKRKIAKKDIHFSNYDSPSINELNQNFNQQVVLYDNAILEMRQNIDEIKKTPEFIESQKKLNRSRVYGSISGMLGCFLGLGGLKLLESRSEKKYERRTI